MRRRNRVEKRCLINSLFTSAVLLTAGPAFSITLPVTSGLIVHMDGSDVTTDISGNVSSWNDQSGQNNHATQSDNTMQPTLESAVTPTGADVIRFDSQDDSTPEHLLIGANTADFDAAGVSWFVVFSAGSETNNRRLTSTAYGDIDPGATVADESQAWGSITDVSTSPTDSGNGYRSLGRPLSEGFNAASAGAGTPSELPENEFVVGSSYVDTATDEVFAMLTLADGSQFTDSNNNATLQLVDHEQTLIGAQSGDDLVIDSTGWTGDIAAFVIYNRALSSQEVSDVTEALRQAYVVPEPASLAVLGLGGLSLLARRKH